MLLKKVLSMLDEQIKDEFLTILLFHLFNEIRIFIPDSEEEGHCECKYAKRKIVLIFTQYLIKYHKDKFFGFFSNICYININLFAIWLDKSVKCKKTKGRYVR